MEFVIAHKLEILAFLFAFSEILALSPLKSNSVFQMISGWVKKAYESVKG